MDDNVRIADQALKTIAILKRSLHPFQREGSQMSRRGWRTTERAYPPSFCYQSSSQGTSDESSGSRQRDDAAHESACWSGCVGRRRLNPFRP